MPDDVKTSWMPLRWSSSSLNVMLAAFGNVDRYLESGSLRLIVPSSANLNASAATKVLLMLPMEKSVSGVTGAFVDSTVEPDTPVHVDPSGNTTAADMPASLPLALAASTAA